MEELIEELWGDLATASVTAAKLYLKTDCPQVRSYLKLLRGDLETQIKYLEDLLDE